MQIWNFNIQSIEDEEQDKTNRTTPMYLSALPQICTSFALEPCDQQTWDCTKGEVLLKKVELLYVCT